MLFRSLLALGVVPHVLVLRRQPRAVARSYLERYTVPGRTKLGWEYLLHPGDPNTLAAPGWQRFSDYQMCFWYALEMERRQRDLPQLVRERGGVVIDASATELGDWDTFHDMLQRLGLVDERLDLEQMRRMHAEITGVVHNKNPRAATMDGDFAREEEQVWAAVAPGDPGLRAWVEARYAG